jgi:ClpX C4-type zinc finger
MEWVLAAAGLFTVGVCLVGILRIKSGSEYTFMYGFVMGLAIGFLQLTLALYRLFGAEPFCAMCRLPRAQVEALIAGDSGALCTDCVPLALAVLDGGPPGPRARTALRTSLQLITQDLDPQTPRAESSSLFAAAIALHPEPEMLRTLARHALRVSNPAAALEALNRIPEPERTAADRSNTSAAQAQLERSAAESEDGGTALPRGG